MKVYIAELVVSAHVAKKIQNKHRIDLLDRQNSITHPNNLVAKWSDSPIYGRRLLVRGLLPNGKQFLAFLYQENEIEGIWNLGTAWTLND